MAENIGSNPTELAVCASGDLLKIHDISHAAAGTSGPEKSIKAGVVVNAFEAQASVPVTGATVTCTPTGSKLWLRINPAGTLANLQVDLPAKATASDGQEVIVTCTQVITAFVCDDNGATEVTGAITALAANQTIIYKYHATDDTWYLIGNNVS